MTDKAEKVAGFREYLQEVKAREKSATLKEYTERLLFQETAREAFDGLVEEGFLLREGLITISAGREKVKGFEKPDFLLAKEDILFQVYLVIDGKVGIINRDFLRGLFDVIQADPKLTAIIAIWNLDGLPACALDAFMLRKYIEIQDNSIDLTNEKISNIDECIKDFYDSQFVDWSIPEDLVIEKESEGVSFTVREVLRQGLEEEFNKIRAKSFRVAEKKEAKETILAVDVDEVLGRLTELLAKSELSTDDFDKLESFLKRVLRKSRSKDD